MTGSGGTTVAGGSGSGSSGSGGGGGTADYAAEAGHAQTADTATEATNLASDSTDWSKILRKDVADTAAEVITFAKGIVSTLVSKFKAGILIGANDGYGFAANGNITANSVSASSVSVDGNIHSDGEISTDADISAGGSVGIGDDLNVAHNAYVTGNLTAAQLIADLLKTPDFAQVAGMIGLGFGVTTDQNGRATLQTDDLVVLGRMVVNALNVREVTYIGGTYLLTPAGSTIVKVMRLYAAQTSQIQYSQYWSTTGSNYAVGYRVMWKADDGTTGTMNYWKVGDQAFCQTFNLTASGQYTTAENRRYWRLVCRVGQVTIDGETFHYADLADIDNVYLYGIPNLFEGRENSSGNAPAEGDKVVCLGSQTDTTRQGAIQLTAEGEASIGIYDGIDLFTSLSNYEIHYFSKSAVRMNAAYITWKTTGGSETQATFMADTKMAFVGIGNCGIDIARGSITAKGGKFQMEDENGNATFILNTNGDLESKGSASFEGTIKSKNFYQTLTLVWSYKKCWELGTDGTHSIYIYYHTLCTDQWFLDYQEQDGQSFSPDDIIEYHEESDPYGDFFTSGNFGVTSSDNFLAYTGESSVVKAVNTLLANNTVALFDMIAIPSASEYAGKRIEIKNTGTAGGGYTGVLTVYAKKNSNDVAHQFFTLVEGYPDYASGNVHESISLNPGESVELWSDGTYWVKL